MMAILLLASCAQAATLTVCPSGCDYSDPQAAVDAANPGDIINVSGGVFCTPTIIHKKLTLKGGTMISPCTPENLKQYAETQQKKPKATTAKAIDINTSREQTSSISDAEETPSSSANELFLKGNELAKQGKLDEAIEAFNRAIKLDPKFSEAWNNKGVALLRQGKYDKALEACNKAIDINPEYVEAWNNKGYIFNKQGKYDKALEALDKATSINPLSVAAWNNKGIAFDGQGNYGEAIKAYNNVIDLDRNNAKAWNNRGTSLVKLGKYDDALYNFNRAVQVDPKYSLAWYNKGIVLKKLGQTAKAQEAFDEAEELGYKARS